MPRKFDAYRLSKRAEIDLADIYAYTVEHWSIDQAGSHIADIRAAINGLVAGTKLGRRRSEIGADYLFHSVGSHLIVYRETEHILIARVLHASMDLPRHLAP